MTAAESIGSRAGSRLHRRLLAITRVHWAPARRAVHRGWEVMMVIETCISNAAYERLVLNDPDRKWELWDGHLREKSAMTYAHNNVAFELGYLLRSRLDRSDYGVRVDAGRVHRPGSTYFIPDVYVFPMEYVTPKLRERTVLEVYDAPLPLVVEVWFSSTGDYDIAEKLAVYKARGDAEIWCIHPYERTLTAWRRRPDGRYEESIHRAGFIQQIALPGVAIDLDALFAG